jgi:hypothetical protein
MELSSAFAFIDWPSTSQVSPLKFAIRTGVVMPGHVTCVALQLVLLDLH